MEAPDRLVRRPSFLVSQLALHTRRLVTDGFAQAGGRGYHYRILAALQEFGMSSQIDLARRCGMDRSDVVAVLNELVADGQVERAPDPGDRRRNVVSITKAGERQLRRLDRAIERVQEDLLEPLSQGEREQLVGLLNRLLDHHGLANR